MKDFLKITSPLMKLTQKNVWFLWYDECEASFQTLKDCLTSISILGLPLGSVGYMVYCNASRVGLGYILMQRGHVVAYASRQLKKHE